MSWASMARKAKDVVAPVPTDAEIASKRVVAVDIKVTENENRLTNNQKHTANSFDIPRPTKGCLVLDANAIIKGLEDYVSRADVLVTTPQVIAECRDRQSRELLERLPVSLVVLDPTQESIHRVVDVATATGDLGALSRTDIRLCALGLDVAKYLGVQRSEIKPRGTQVNPGDGIQVHDDDAEIEEEEEEEEEEDAGDDDKSGAPVAAAAAGNADDSSSDSDDDKPVPLQDRDLGGSDGEGDWITPENVADQVATELMDENEINAEPYLAGFATATSDFPMQNVLLHLGVSIIGPQGFVIKELRQWLLRCHACFCLVTDTTRQFCPDCGSGDTLKRVSYIISEDGQKKLFINFKRHISTRGTIYTLPKPRGGRNGTNRTLVLREDQLALCGRAAEKFKRRAATGADDDLKGFGEMRSQRGGATHLKTKSSYQKYNVNEKKKLRAARRK